MQDCTTRVKALEAERDALIRDLASLKAEQTATVDEAERLRGDLAKAVEAMDAVVSYNDEPAQTWRQKHPEFAAAMIAERDKYGMVLHPEVFIIARHLRAALASIKENQDAKS